MTDKTCGQCSDYVRKRNPTYECEPGNFEGWCAWRWSEVWSKAEACEDIDSDARKWGATCPGIKGMHTKPMEK